MEELFNGKELMAMGLLISIVTPIATALTQAIKKSVPNYPKELTPLVTIVVSIGLCYMAWIFTELETGYRLWAGLLAGLGSAGFYDLSKLPFKTLQKPKNTPN